MSSQFLEVIEKITQDDQYPEQFGLIHELIKNQSGNDVDKQPTKDMVDMINIIISETGRDPKTKYYAIQIIKDLSLKKYQTFISILSSSKLLQNMIKIAKNTDPKKKMEEKGRTYFKDPSLGNKFITLLLECICNWGQRFPENSKKAPTKFKLGLTELQQAEVVLPKNLIFFKPDNNKKDSKKQSKIDKQTPGNQGINLKSIQGNLKFSINKIEGFFQSLSENDNDQNFQNLQADIKRYHTQFQKQRLNLQNIANKIFQMQPQPDQQLTEMVINLSQFYEKEQQSYKKYFVTNKDIRLYIDNVKKDAANIENYFVNKIQKKQSKNQYNSRNSDGEKSKLEQKRQQQEREKRQIQIQREKERELEKQRERQIEKQNRSSKISDDKKMREEESLRNQKSKISKKQQLPQSQPSFGNLKELQNEKQEHQKQLKKYLAKTTSVGFGAIRQQLDRQRNYTKASGAPRRKSPSPISQYNNNHKSKSNYSQNFNQSISQSKVSVFELHPDIKVSRTNYSGKVVPMRIDFNSQIEDMNIGQGIKRFKSANFKNKGLLFENDYLQIGYKSEVIYEDLEKFKSFLKLTLYFGNKSDIASISHLDIDYEGDQTNILYCNPLKIQSIIDAGVQLKQQLVIIPMEQSFTFINFKIKYMYNKSINRFNIILPNSILKFTVFEKIDIISFKKQYKNIKARNHLLRSIPFKLSRNLPPATLKKYLSNLTELTDYQQFLAQKEYFQYKLIGGIVILDNQQYLLKLRIRPDMTVVIQLAAVNATEDTIKYGYFVLQTLQFLLQKQN